MTELAGGRETGVRHGTGGTREILLVARNARSIRDGVIVDAVAIRARPWRNRVRSRQGESGFRVVETCRLPRGSRMAEFASLRKATCHVVGILRALKIR